MDPMRRHLPHLFTAANAVPHAAHAHRSLHTHPHTHTVACTPDGSLRTHTHTDTDSHPHTHARAHTHPHTHTTSALDDMSTAASDYLYVPDAYPAVHDRDWSLLEKEALISTSGGPSHLTLLGPNGHDCGKSGTIQHKPNKWCCTTRTLQKVDPPLDPRVLTIKLPKATLSAEHAADYAKLLALVPGKKLTDADDVKRYSYLSAKHRECTRTTARLRDIVETSLKYYVRNMEAWHDAVAKHDADVAADSLLIPERQRLRELAAAAPVTDAEYTALSTGKRIKLDSHSSPGAGAGSSSGSH